MIERIAELEAELKELRTENKELTDQDEINDSIHDQLRSEVSSLEDRLREFEGSKAQGHAVIILSSSKTLLDEQKEEFIQENWDKLTLHSLESSI